MVKDRGPASLAGLLGLGGRLRDLGSRKPFCFATLVQSAPHFWQASSMPTQQLRQGTVDGLALSHGQHKCHLSFSCLVYPLRWGCHCQYPCTRGAVALLDLLPALPLPLPPLPIGVEALYLPCSDHPWEDGASLPRQGEGKPRFGCDRGGGGVAARDARVGRPKIEPKGLGCWWWCCC